MHKFGNAAIYVKGRVRNQGVYHFSMPWMSLDQFIVKSRSRPQTEPRKQLNKKFDHLVLGPAAGQGLSNRLQCQGSKALNRTHSSNDRLGVDGSITFVTVFTIYNSSLDRVDDKSSKTVVGNTSYNKMGRSMAVLNVFIQVVMPQSDLIILTDPVFDLSVHRNRVSLYPIQGEYSRDKLMLQRIRNNKGQPLNSGLIAVRGTSDGILRARQTYNLE
ncbi:hypothetical protein KIW84_045615 [Lathyrus oleraceus]|uniref:Uncharacterized protein n=1 Tax=Pisum sativum TaxID=3888 RepID=A0A9D4XIZ1_PEA|nr:hypothetical protein KIW84_045615 [Pisum sativum]